VELAEGSTGKDRKSSAGGHKPGDDSGVLICTTGKSVRLCNCGLSSPVCKNISVFQKCKSSYMIRHPTPTEGRIMIVTYAGRDAVDAAAPARMI
jgi:hypothetical protein